MLDDLYREVILDHARRPRNRGALAEATQRVAGLNPVCGDEIELDLIIHGGTVGDVAFRGQGCSISQASCSMLTERVKGLSVAEAGRVADDVRTLLTGMGPSGREVSRLDGLGDLGDLELLAGVAKFPVRVKCALLCWNVLEEGLQQATLSGGSDGSNGNS